MTCRLHRGRALPALARVILLLALGLAPPPAAAQDRAFVQVEAKRDLAEARAAAARYAETFPEVAGFRLPSGWHAIALGPFPDRAAAEAARRRLLTEGRIPADAFVLPEARTRDRFWPDPAGGTAPAAAPPAARQAAPPAADAPGGETPAEARAAEARLDRDARAEIQAALAWFGHYGLAIDGLFGPGTRAAIADWQAAQGAAPTGVLTTAERRALLAAWAADTAAFGFARFRDAAAGLEIDLPLGLVAFAATEPPFLRFEPRGDSGLAILLISQQGSRDSLAALYAVMQTLPVIPPGGARALGGDAFTLTGRNAMLRSHSFARHRDGHIHGFALIWEAAADARAARVLPRLEASLRPVGPALPPATAAASPGPAAASPGPGDRDAPGPPPGGADLRRPARSFSGFFVDGTGRVLTSAALAEGCRRLVLDGRTAARVGHRDAGLGAALLVPEDRLAPRATARLAPAPPAPGAEVALAGYAFDDLLTRPVLTFGRLAAPEGLQGEPALRRLALAALPGDVGGPVLDRSGRVVGMLLPQPAPQGRRLPEDAGVALGAEAIAALLAGQGLRPAAAAAAATPLSDAALARLAEQITVLVSCWD